MIEKQEKQKFALYLKICVLILPILCLVIIRPRSGAKYFDVYNTVKVNRSGCNLAEERIYRDFMNKIRIAPDVRRINPAKKIDFVIAGAKKCGTSALKDFIGMHPQTRLNQLYAYEGHYFDIACSAKTTEECLSLENRQKYYYGAQIYEDQPHSDYLDFEATPAYFTTPGVAKLLKLYNPSIKVIIILCDPVSRALSDFRQQKIIAETDNLAGNIKATFIKAAFEKELKSKDAQFEDLVSEAIRTINDTDPSVLISQYSNMQANFWQNLSKQKLSTNETIRKTIMKVIDSVKFNPLIKIILDGIYGKFLREYMQYFTLGDSLLVVNQQTLLTSPFHAISSVHKFLGLQDFLTLEMFIRPGGSPFYCLNVTEVAMQNEKFWKRSTRDTSNTTRTNLTTIKSQLRCNSGLDKHVSYFQVKNFL